MYNFFMVANNTPYQINTLPTQIQGHIGLEKSISVTETRYTKLFEKYALLKSKFQQIKQQNIELKEYIKQLDDVFQPDSKRPKIKRRPEIQLKKDHSCPYLLCKKEYASALALNLHIKNKHQGGTKKERLAFIKQLISAKEKGYQPPATTLKICSKLLESELKEYKQKINHEINTWPKNQDQEQKLLEQDERIMNQ